MADVTSIYGNPIKDAVARADISTLQTDVQDVKDGLETVQTDLAQTTAVALAAYATDTASGAMASFPDGADNVPVKSLTVDIEPVQSGSGDPSPTNVRPISGHTSATVTRCGKNLATKTIHGYVRVSDKKVLIDNDSESVVFYAESGKTYTVSSSATMGRSILGLASTDEITSGFQLDNAIELSGSVNTWTATWTGWTVWYKCPNAQSAFANSVQVEQGSTATAYESPNIQTVTIDLDGTRYGGTLNVETGVLTVDRVIKTLDGSEDNWVYASGSGGYFYYNPTAALFPNIKTYDSTVISNRLKTVGDGTAFASNTFCIYNASQLNFKCDTSVNTVALFKSWLGNNPLTVVYPLATPTTVQLTAQDDITTVLGQNNVWNDCGDTEVEYRADTKLYIEKLTAPTEDDMIADHAISANSFFMVGNTLYRATTAIASGATITVGTNATRLSLSDALNALS